MTPLAQHQLEIQKNLRAWRAKPLLQEIYAAFYREILALIDPQIPGRVVEIGSGIGNLKAHLPGAITTDLFPNPWLDLVCDGYDLPFKDGAISHLVLFDVWHHLRAPKAFLDEARRVLGARGRIILFEPYISWASRPVYGLLHHEPIAWNQPINLGETLPRPRDYYAAQGNATRLFFERELGDWPPDWKLWHTQAISSFSYLLSGGYSKPAMYPAGWLKWMQEMDASLNCCPRWFGARCLVALEKV